MSARKKPLSMEPLISSLTGGAGGGAVDVVERAVAGHGQEGGDALLRLGRAVGGIHPEGRREAQVGARGRRQVAS